MFDFKASHKRVHNRTANGLCSHPLYTTFSNVSRAYLLYVYKSMYYVLPLDKLFPCLMLSQFPDVRSQRVKEKQTDFHICSVVKFKYYKFLIIIFLAL